MDLPALASMSNLHEPHQNKNHSLIGAVTLLVISGINHVITIEKYY